MWQCSDASRSRSQLKPVTLYQGIRRRIAETNGCKSKGRNGMAQTETGVSVSAPSTAPSTAASSSKTEHVDKLLQHQKSETLDCLVACLSSIWTNLLALSDTKSDLLATVSIKPLVDSDEAPPIALSMSSCVPTLLFSWISCLLLFQSKVRLLQYSSFVTPQVSSSPF